MSADNLPKSRSCPSVPVMKRIVHDMAGSYVGFANLPNQVHRKSVKKDLSLLSWLWTWLPVSLPYAHSLPVLACLMSVHSGSVHGKETGESGLGKSTLINSLFLTDLYKDRTIPSAIDRIRRTVTIDTSTVEIEERGVKLRLTVVDTPGYGDGMDNQDSFKPILNYVNEKFETYLKDESGLNRRNIIDNRVHCCFYFIAPTGRGLKPLDIEFMKILHDKVNIIPVIGKADTLTPTELETMKRQILDEIDEYGIKIYDPPCCDSDEDEDFIEQTKQLKACMPFAVVGSNTIIEICGKKVRGRLYPWGVVEVENPTHCDFIKLRTMLITHMEDMKEVTNDVHYENFRAGRLSEQTGEVS